MNEPDVRLPTTAVSFQAENARDWVVRFWQIPGKWVGIAFPFGFVLWVLFYFDHNVSVCRLSRNDFKFALCRSQIKGTKMLIGYLVIDRSRIRVPIEETTWIPLGFLLARVCHFLFRSIRSTRLERYVPLSTCP